MARNDDDYRLKGGIKVLALVDATHPDFDRIARAADEQGLHIWFQRNKRKKSVITLREHGSGQYPFSLPEGVSYDQNLVLQIQSQIERWGDNHSQTVYRVTATKNDGAAAFRLPETTVSDQAREQGVIARVVDHKCLVIIRSCGYLDGDFFTSFDACRFEIEAAGSRVVFVTKTVLSNQELFAKYGEALVANLDCIREELEELTSGEPNEQSTAPASRTTPAINKPPESRPTQPQAPVAKPPEPSSVQTPIKPNAKDGPLRHTDKDRQSRTQRLFPGQVVRRAETPGDDPDSVGNR